MNQDSRFPLLLHKAFARFWPRKYLIFVSYCAVVWLAILVALFGSPTYEVTAIISIKPGALFVADPEKIAAAAPEQFARPQITLLESETVVRRAVSAVGGERLYRAKTGGLQLPHIARGPLKSLFPALSLNDYAYMTAKKNLTIRQEPQTDIIMVTFRNSDPRVAVDFTNALVRSFSQRFFEVYSNTGAVDFFWEQKKKSEEAFTRTSKAFAAYSSHYGLFSIQEQRGLLLQQRSATAAALIVTRGSIAEKESQVAAIPGLLAQLKQPLARSAMMKSLTGPQKSDTPPPPETSSLMLSAIADRVYQDTVASLVRTHTEIAGRRALEVQQEQSLKDIDSQLTSMAAREAEFERLQLEVTQLKANAELFSKKAFEEQLAQDLNERKFTPVQILQEATLPLKPIWPRPVVLLVFGFVLCFVPGLAAAGIHHALVNETKGGPDGTRPQRS